MKIKIYAKGYCPRKNKSFNVEISKELAEKYPASNGYVNAFPERQVDGVAFNMCNLLEGEGYISSAPVSNSGVFARWEIHKVIE